MIDEEAQGVLARLAVVRRDVEIATAKVKEAKAVHWKHEAEHELYAALRRADELEAQLRYIGEQPGRRIK